jgi:hypothetical protein
VESSSSDYSNGPLNEDQRREKVMKYWEKKKKRKS